MFGKSFKLSLLFIFSTIAIAAQHDQKGHRIEPSIFGDLVIEDKVIDDLLESPVMQRLHEIDQSGTPQYYTSHVPSFTRYDHSVGVYALLKKVGAPLNEQIAGLLHDASHTVFSHTGDWVVGKAEQDNAHQDEIHGWYLEQMDVGEILAPYGIKIEQVIHKDNDHTALEQDLPDMCADRIEYNLHTAYLFGMLSKPEIRRIVNDLRFENDKWYFTDPHLARRFANFSIYFTEYLWGSPFNQVLNHLSGRLLKRALEIHLLSEDDFHFGIDSNVLAKLEASNDPQIKELLGKCQNYQEYYEVVQDGPYDFITKPKFRGIDPLVKVSGKLVRLTSIDPDYAREYERVRSHVKNGIKVRLL